MAEEIILKASDPSPSSRSFDWPVLEAGNSSYENGIYSITCKPEQIGKSIQVQHKIQGASLIEHWITSGKVAFICSVASPRSMYRKLHKSPTPQQLIAWETEDLGEHPIFTTMIVANEEIQHTIDSVTDGLNPAWDGKKIHLLKGARIAVGPTFKFQTGINMLLDFNSDEKLAPGQLRVERKRRRWVQVQSIFGPQPLPASEIQPKRPRRQKHNGPCGINSTEHPPESVPRTGGWGRRRMGIVPQPGGTLTHASRARLQALVGSKLQPREGR